MHRNILNAALCLLALLPVAHAQLYSYAIESMNAEDLGTFGGQNSEVVDVNHLGDMVGWAEYANGQRHALLMRNTGTGIEDFTLGMDAHTYANGINDVMEVVGYSESTPGSAHARAFYRMEGQPLKYLQPFFDYSAAYAINNLGMIAGVKSGPIPNIPGSPCLGLMPLRWIAASNWYDTLWCASGQQLLRATDINNLNLIVGWSNAGPQNVSYAWTWNEGTVTLVPPPTSPACGMRALGVNNTGSVVGFASMCNSGARAIVWNGYDSNSTVLGVLPGGNASQARELNEQNFIVGVSEQLVNGGFLGAVSRNRGFIYHKHFGMKALPIPTGYTGFLTTCEANALGARQVASGIIRIGGSCTVGSTRHAVRWTVVAIQGPPNIQPL